MRGVGLFCQHPLQAITYQAPQTIVDHACPKCGKAFTGEARLVLNEYREHVLSTHLSLLDDCGCCGAYHFPEFAGDCREDWERF